jgi:RNA polymerase sigma-70 factor (ECF subfamily)
MTTAGTMAIPRRTMGGPVRPAAAHADAARSSEDAALAARAREGDEAAFEDLVRRYRNDVFGLAYHFTRNREDAWDLAQEAFVKAHRGLRRFRGDASLRTWLLRITANHCRDFLKRRRLNTVPLEDARETDAARQDTPASSASAREAGDAILAVLETLPFKHRTAFILREFEGLSYAAMAEVMNCSQGTVMSRLHYAREKMREGLRRLGFGEEGSP